MAHLIANLPPIHCFIRREFLYDFQEGHGEYEPCIWVSIKSLRSQAFRIEAYLNNYGALYDKLPLHAFCWKPIENDNVFISNFAYPLLVDNVDELSEILFNKGIENRPLVCGSINEQPFWYERYEKVSLPNSKIIHNNGLYIPNNQTMNSDDIKYISNIINEYGKEI